MLLFCHFFEWHYKHMQFTNLKANCFFLNPTYCLTLLQCFVLKLPQFQSCTDQTTFLNSWRHFFGFCLIKKNTQYKRVVVRSLKALFCSISIQLFPCVGQEPQQHDWCWNLFRPLSCYSGRAGTPTKRWWETNKQLCVCTLHLLMRSSPVRLRLTDKNTACFWGTSMPLSL